MKIDKMRSRRRLPFEVSTRDGSQFDWLIVIDVVMTEQEYALYMDQKAKLLGELFK